MEHIAPMRRLRPVLLLALAPLLLTACLQDETPPVHPGYASVPARQVKPSLVLGVHPLHNPGRLFALYGPFIEALNQAIPEYDISLETSRDYADYERKIRARRLELLIPNPYQTLIAQNHGYHVFAKVSGDDDFRGILVVRKDDRELKRIEDLRGKTISYPPPTATAGVLMQQLHIQEHGVNVLHEVDNRYVGSQESAIMHVALGMSDVGSTWPPPWRNFQKDHPDLAARLEVRWVTPSLPNLSIMARDDLPPALVDNLRAKLLAIAATTKGRRMLGVMELPGIEPANDAAYAPVHDFAQRFNDRVHALPLN